MSSVSLLHPELRGVLVVNIAKCIFVKHALSRTCRAFRKLFTNELFLRIMQALHPSLVIPFVDANPVSDSAMVIYAVFPFKELLPQLEARIIAKDPNPFHFNSDFMLYLRARCYAKSISLTQFQFGIIDCDERYGVVQKSTGEQIGPRICHLFGCNCNVPISYFANVNVVWKHSAVDQCLSLDLIR